MTQPASHCTPVTNLACPIDASPLQLDGAAFKCSTGHSFDRARAGYANLLVVQHKASRDPGDSREMVGARHRFLAGGAYAPIAECVSGIVIVRAREHRGSEFRVLDAGCGEGYYLEAISSSADLSTGCDLQLAGIDISKWAIQAAAKRKIACFWAVASNRHPPFTFGSVDLIVSMFGFSVWPSFAAVQPVGGRVLLVDPGPEHLIELRSVIYPTVLRTAPPGLKAALSAGYRLDGERRLKFSFIIESKVEITDLLAMTPHDHRAPSAGREALSRLDRLAVTGDVVVRQLVRS